MFDFTAGHVSAVAATLFDLLLLGVVTAELSRLRRVASPETSVTPAAHAP